MMDFLLYHLSVEGSVGTVLVGPVAGMFADELPELVDISAPWWHAALIGVFWAGLLFLLSRVVWSVCMIRKVIGKGKIVLEEDGCKIVVSSSDIGPFSWMRYIVLSEDDYKENAATILTHEKAHIRYGHSFVVAKDGAVKDVKIVNSICEELDNLVLSLIQESPKWEPATLKGKPVEQCLRIPIAFDMR